MRKPLFAFIVSAMLVVSGSATASALDSRTVGAAADRGTTSLQAPVGKPIEALPGTVTPRPPDPSADVQRSDETAFCDGELVMRGAGPKQPGGGGQCERPAAPA